MSNTVRFTITRVIHAPSDAVWRVLGDFGAEHRWRLTELEPGRTLAYVLDGPAGPFASAASKWSTTATSEGSTAVTVEGRFETKNWFVRAFVWPLARPMLRRLTRRVVGELATFLAGDALVTAD